MSLSNQANTSKRTAPAVSQTMPIALLTTGAFLAICVETLFSVPYRTIHLATHSAPRSWVVGLLGLAICALVYRSRHRLGRSAETLREMLPASRRSLLASLTVGVLLRLLWVICFHPPLASDGKGYFIEATNVAQRHFYDGTFWPPGFPLFLSPFIMLLGAHFYVAVLVGMLLFAGTLVLTRQVTLQMTGSAGAAALSGWLLALWPGYIAIVDINSKEALIACILPLVMGLLYGSGTWMGKRLWLAMLGIGVLCGFAALTQPGLMLFPSVVFLAQWLITRRFPAALLRTTVATCAMAATILPWTIRNYVDYGRVIPISSNGGSVFYRANNPRANASYSAEGETVLPADTVAADREGYGMAKEWITHHPGAFLMLAVRKQVVYLGDDGDGVYEGLKRNQSPSTLLYAGLKGLTSLYWFLLWLALLCCCRSLFRSARWPLWFGVAFLPFTYQWVIDSIYESGSRHHMAHVSCVAVLVSCAWASIQQERSTAAAVESQADRLVAPAISM